MYDPEKSFGFIHHYEVPDNFLSVNSFGREATDAEKKKIIRDNEGFMLGMPKGHQMTATLGLLAPLENVSEDAQSR